MARFLIASLQAMKFYVGIDCTRWKCCWNTEILIRGKEGKNSGVFGEFWTTVLMFKAESWVILLVVHPQGSATNKAETRSSVSTGKHRI